MSVAPTRDARLDMLNLKEIPITCIEYTGRDLVNVTKWQSLNLLSLASKLISSFNLLRYDPPADLRSSLKDVCGSRCSSTYETGCPLSFMILSEA